MHDKIGKYAARVITPALSATNPTEVRSMDRKPSKVHRYQILVEVKSDRRLTRDEQNHLREDLENAVSEQPLGEAFLLAESRPATYAGAGEVG